MSANPKALTEEFLRLLGFTNVVVTEQLVPEGVLLSVQCDNAARLIGHQGQTLSEFQYLINRLIYHADPTAPKVTLDVGNYRANVREALLTRARAAADKVRRWGDIVELEPMNAYERYLVHQALKDDPDVETHSVAVDGSPLKVIQLRPRRPTD